MNRAEHLFKVATEAGVTVACAESCTGGLLAGAITDVPGASAMFDRGFVTYTNAAKREMLGVAPGTLEAFGAVSEQVAREMAQGALARSHATMAVAVTGIAGPGGSDHKPEGRVCFAVACAINCVTRTDDFGPIGRANVRAASVQRALQLLIEAVGQP